jgi:hypothetical protein
VKRDREDQVFQGGGRPSARRAEREGLAEGVQGAALRGGERERGTGGVQRPSVGDRRVVSRR